MSPTAIRIVAALGLLAFWCILMFAMVGGWAGK